MKTGNFKKSVAVLLCGLMLLSSLAMLVSAASLFDDTILAGDGWVTVDGKTIAEGAWQLGSGDELTDEKKDYSYSFKAAYDGQFVYLGIKTDDGLKPMTNGDAFRFWLRDDESALLYTDFVTLKVVDGQLALSNAKFNQSKIANQGANWTDENIAKIEISQKQEGDTLEAMIKLPAIAFDGKMLKSKGIVNVWATVWNTDIGASAALHSGDISDGKAPHAAWNNDADYELDLADKYFLFNGEKDGFNKKVAGADNTIFTPAFGTEVTSATGNISWATNIIVNSVNGNYVVDKIIAAPGANATIAIPENGFILSVHSDGIDARRTQKWLANKLLPGDMIVLSDINIADATKGENPALNIAKYAINRPYNVKTFVTEGKTYTTSEAPNRGDTDGWKDDGKKLTDGIVGPASGGDTTYSAWNGTRLDVIVNLGAVTNGIADFETHMTGGSWGIAAPVSVAYYVSNDNIVWNYVGTAQRGQAVDTDETWASYDFKLSLDKGVSAQYIKYEITAGSHVWVSECAAYSYAAPARLYSNMINDLNYSTVDTESMEGIGRVVTGKIPDALGWSKVVIFKYDSEANAYKVTEINAVTDGQEKTALANKELADDEFAYVINTGNNYPALVEQGRTEFEGKPNYQTPEILSSFSAIDGIAVGDTAYLYNINITFGQVSRNLRSFIAINSKVNDDIVYTPDFATTAIGTKAPENIAEGKAVSYNIAANAGYPDTEGKTMLTDGVYGEAGTVGDAGWVGFSGSDSYEFIVDLGAETDGIYALSSQYLSYGWGIWAPSRVSYYGSADGVNYFYICDSERGADTVKLDDDGNKIGSTFESFDFYKVLDKGISARYIKVVAERDSGNGASFVFIGEIEVLTNTENYPFFAETEDGSIKVETEDNVFPYGTEVVIDNAEATDAQSDAIAKKYGEKSEFMLFDIYFKYNGERIQPAEGKKVKFTFTLSEEYADSDIKVAHFAEDGKLEEIASKVTDGVLTFEADSFSNYAFVVPVENPPTGDMTVTGIAIAVLALMLAAGAAYILKRRA